MKVYMNIVHITVDVSQFTEKSTKDHFNILIVKHDLEPIPSPEPYNVMLYGDGDKLYNFLFDFSSKHNLLLI